MANPILHSTETTRPDLGAKGIVPRPPQVEQVLQSPERALRCSACGIHHGSIGQELRCLTAELANARARFAALSPALVAYCTAVRKRNEVLRVKRAKTGSGGPQDDLTGLQEELDALKALRKAAG